MMFKFHLKRMLFLLISIVLVVALVILTVCVFDTTVLLLPCISLIFINDLIVFHKFKGDLFDQDVLNSLDQSDKSKRAVYYVFHFMDYVMIVIAWVIFFKSLV